jgi:hypothetical protein
MIAHLINTVAVTMLFSLAPLLAQAAPPSVDSQVADSILELIPLSRTDSQNCILGYKYEKLSGPRKGHATHQTTITYKRLGVEQERILFQKELPVSQSNVQKTRLNQHVRRVLRSNDERLCAKQDDVGGGTEATLRTQRPPMDQAVPRGGQP